MKTEILTTEYQHAADLIRAGELVAVPTETVYGLAGNGLDVKAVEQIYEVKGRPTIKPLSLMVPGAGAMEKICVNVPKAAHALAEQFWPGPLTIVLESSEKVPEIVRAGGTTVGLRCPDHPATLALLRCAGVPFAAPSANPSGEPSPKTAGEVLGYFGGKIAAVVDGGPCGIGKESTIVDLSRTPYRILRPGALPESEVWDALVKRMRIVGVTGGSGCGKTTFLEALARRGAMVLDCDAVYHELLRTSKPMLSESDARFPGVVENGELQIKRLGEIVFRDAAALQDLNTITHRYITEEIRRRLTEHARNGGTSATIDAIALIESGAGALCDLVIGITAPREARIERLLKRESITRAYAESRIDAQKPNAWFAEHCDRILENNDTLDVFEKQCEKLSMEVLE